MLGFNHTLAGSIVAVIVPAPFVPIVALVSHYLLDMLPHFGASDTVKPYTTSFKRLLITDAILCIVALIFAIILFPEQWLIIMIGAFFGTAPDFLWILQNRGPRWLDIILDWSEWIQWGERPYGWILDAIYALLMAITLYLLAGQPWS